MLNFGYIKSISKVIDNRLYCLFPKLNDADQNGFVKGRNIGDIIRLMFDIVDYTNCKKVSGAVLSVDLRKAFDSLKWSFIFKMLICMNLVVQ